MPTGRCRWRKTRRRPPATPSSVCTRTSRPWRTGPDGVLRVPADRGRADGIAYVAQPGGQPPTRFALAEQADRRVVFADPAHDFPQRLVSRSTTPARCTPASKVRRAAAVRQEWTWTRRPARLRLSARCWRRPRWRARRPPARPAASTRGPGRPPVSSDRFESHPAFDPAPASSTSCAVRPRSRAGISSSAAAPRAGWSTARGRLRSPPDAIEADPWFTPRRGDPLLHLHARVRRQERQGPRHLARRAHRGRLLGRARAIAGARELERDGVVPAPRAGWIALLRIEAARRPRRQRHLARTARCRRPLVRGESRPGDQHGERRVRAAPERRRQTPDRRDGRRLLRVAAHAGRLVGETQAGRRNQCQRHRDRSPALAERTLDALLARHEGPPGEFFVWHGRRGLWPPGCPAAGR